jgi:hypothetical protein
LTATHAEARVYGLGQVLEAMGRGILVKVISIPD